MSADPKQMSLPNQKSQLSMENTIKLVDWLRKQDLTDTTPARLAVSAEASLGFRVTSNNIKGALSAAGLRITAALSLEERNAAKMDAIAAAVVVMYSDQGVIDQLPREFTEAFGQGFIDESLENRL